MSRESDERLVAYAETVPVYFVISETDRLIKIGFSSNVRQRMQALVGDNNVSGPLALVGWILGGPSMEADLHEQFASDRVAGEWFRPSAVIAEFIAENCERTEPPVTSLYGARLSARGYWAARRRLNPEEFGATGPRKIVIDHFGSEFHTIEPVSYPYAPKAVA